MPRGQQVLAVGIVAMTVVWVLIAGVAILKAVGAL